MGTCFRPEDYPDLLVGLGIADDAAVYRLNDEQAIIQTTDFFTPIVDTPYEFGAIAAANALSDVYAMGGEVLLALNIVAFPPDLPAVACWPRSCAAARRWCASAGAPIAGGHTIQDKEPKYGLAVTGMVHPDRDILTKGGARPGDLLVLTKPLGTGTITTAVKRGQAEPAHVEAAVASMMRLNRAARPGGPGCRACAAPPTSPASACSGHALEMAQAGRRALPHPLRCLALAARRLAVCRGSGSSRAARTTTRPTINGPVTYIRPLADWQETLLHDPQTSGGLLLAVPAGGRSTDLPGDFCAGDGQAGLGDRRHGRRGRRPGNHLSAHEGPDHLQPRRRAAGQDGRTRSWLAELLEQQGWESRRPGDERWRPGDAGFGRRAADLGCDVVFVIGGDGTMAQAVDGLVGTPHCPGGAARRHGQRAGPAVRPAGTRGLAPARHCWMRLQLLLDGRVRPVDVGRVQPGGRPSATSSAGAASASMPR